MKRRFIIHPPKNSSPSHLPKSRARLSIPLHIYRHHKRLIDLYYKMSPPYPAHIDFGYVTTPTAMIHWPFFTHPTPTQLYSVSSNHLTYVYHHELPIRALEQVSHSGRQSAEPPMLLFGSNLPWEKLRIDPKTHADPTPLYHPSIYIYISRSSSKYACSSGIAL